MLMVPGELPHYASTECDMQSLKVIGKLTLRDEVSIRIVNKSCAFRRRHCTDVVGIKTRASCNFEFYFYNEHNNIELYFEREIKSQHQEKISLGKCP